MKGIYYLLFAFALYACSVDSSQHYKDQTLSPERRAELLLKEMTLEEKVGQMCQYVGSASLETPEGIKNEDERVKYELGLGKRAELIRKGHIGSFLKVPSYKEANYLQELARESRLQIPLLIATDAIHGHAMYVPPATIFPTPIGMAASFDTEMVETIARYTAREMRATGYHWTFSPNVEVVRDARWGRFGETFGEDPLLVSAMGKAMIKGYQGDNMSEAENVMACAKHFAGGGIAYNGLNGAPADISERTLYEIFFPPFEEAINVGVATIMPAHNQLNGIPCHAHHEYLTNLIRGDWKFSGFFISDWMDIERLYDVNKIVHNHKEAAEVAVNAGLDMHMHGPEFLEFVVELVEEQKIDKRRIDEAVLKILTAKFRLGLFEDPFVDSSQVHEVLLQKEHMEYALKSARKSMVLLKNSNRMLPLSDSLPLSVFITGPLANHQAILGDWSRELPDSLIVTILEGVRENSHPASTIDYLEVGEIDQISEEDIRQAGLKARKKDLAIVVVGENAIRFSAAKTSGENLDRPTLELVANQLDLVKEVVNTGVPTLVIYVNGGPVSSPWIAENATAVLEVWEPGMMGGQAAADIIYGKYNPSGRLPATFPRTVGQVQNVYNYNPSAYHRGNYKFMDKTPLYKFGYGLSYTDFTYTGLTLKDTLRHKEDLVITFNVKNTGTMAGDEVVMVFINDIISKEATPVKKLVAFERIHLIPGESSGVSFNINQKLLGYINTDLQHTLEEGEFQVIIGLDKLKDSFWLKN